jgi:hypothetical protein
VVDVRAASTSPTVPRIAQWIAALEERKRRLSDPERVAELDLLIEHLAAEDERDLPRTMATLSDRGTYHSWGGRSSYTATVRKQEVLYRTALDASPHTFHLAMEIERYFSGPDGICMDGVLHKQATADEIATKGYALPDGAHSGEPLVLSRRMALMVSFIDGLMAGEDMYRDDHGIVTTAAAWSTRFASPKATGGAR